MDQELSAEEMIEQVGPGAPEPVETAPPAPPEQHTIKYRDKEETYPIQKILEFANQGRDYTQRMTEFKAREMGLQKQYPKDLTDRLSRYSEMESYIKENPAWWDFLNQQWQSRQSNGQGNPGNPQNPATEDLLSHPVIKSVVSEMETLRQERAQQKELKEDEQLAQNISQYREKYAHFDWNSVDDKNLNLEQRILNHAIENGIKSFKAAANDYLHDEHLSRAQVAAKEQVGKEIQKTTKLGLGPPTTTPQLKGKPIQNVRNKSWEEITQEAIAELG